MGPKYGGPLLWPTRVNADQGKGSSVLPPLEQDESGCTPEKAPWACPVLRSCEASMMDMGLCDIDGVLVAEHTHPSPCPLMAAPARRIEPAGVCVV